MVEWGLGVGMLVEEYEGKSDHHVVRFVTGGCAISIRYRSGELERTGCTGLNAGLARWEGSGRATQAAARLSVVCCAIFRHANCGALRASVSDRLLQWPTATTISCPPQPRPARCLPPWAARAPGAAGPGALCPTGDAWAIVANVIPGLGGQLTRLLPPPRPRPRRADRPPRAPGAARSE